MGIRARIGAAGAARCGGVGGCGTERVRPTGPAGGPDPLETASSDSATLKSAGPRPNPSNVKPRPAKGSGDTANFGAVSRPPVPPPPERARSLHAPRRQDDPANALARVQGESLRAFSRVVTGPMVGGACSCAFQGEKHKQRKGARKSFSFEAWAHRGGRVLGFADRTTTFAVERVGSGLARVPPRSLSQQAPRSCGRLAAGLLAGLAFGRPACGPVRLLAGLLSRWLPCGRPACQPASSSVRTKHATCSLEHPIRRAPSRSDPYGGPWA